MSKMRLYGAAAELFSSEAREVLADSGARCGKSHAAMVKARWTAENYPGCRQLFTRCTRKSMTTTILPDFADFVLGPGHPALPAGRPKGWTELIWPNGSVIDIIGADDTQKILSGQWDRITWFQAEEIPSLQDWNRLLTRLSLENTPYQQMIADVNPAEDTNMMNVRGDSYVCEKCGRTELGQEECHGAPMVKLMHRIRFRLEDNPRWFEHNICRACGVRWDGEEVREECPTCGSTELGDWTDSGREYMTTLNRLTGVQRDRLRDHKWVAATGLVLPEFDRGRHMVHYETSEPDQHVREKTEDGKWRLAFDSWFATWDWGYRDASALDFWGVKGGRLYRVWEAYFHERQPEFFYDCLSEIDGEVGGLEDLVMSHERPEMIDKANQRLGDRRGHKDIVVARKTLWMGKDVGVQDVKRYLTEERVFLCYDADRWGHDKDLASQGLPRSMETEITAWVWLDPEKRKVGDKDRPDPDCEDHAMDGLQWAVLAHGDAGKSGFVPPPPVPEAPKGSYAEATGMFDVPLEG